MTKTLVSSVVFILFFALSAKCEIFEGSVSRPAVNAAQVFVMDPSYKNDVGAFFREAKAKGVDTVYFRVFHNSGDRSHFGISPACSSGVYFKTEEL